MTAAKQAQRTKPDAVFANATAKAITLDMFRVQAEAKQAIIDDLLAALKGLFDPSGEFLEYSREDVARALAAIARAEA